MSEIASAAALGAAVPPRRAGGLWSLALGRLRADPVGMAAFWVVAAFAVLVALAQLGVVGSQWDSEVGVPFAPPHFVGPGQDETQQLEQAAGSALLDISAVDPLAPSYSQWQARAAAMQTQVSVKSATLIFGADRIGRDVLAKAIKGAQVSITVGVAAALLATLIGTVLGAVAGYFGGWIDDLLEWAYNVFNAVPYVLLIFALAAVFKSGPLAKLFSSGIAPVVIILSVVGWTGIYRLVRAEYIKHRSREYVRAAEAIGVGHGARMFGHILPNVGHVVLVQLSLHAVGFIKAEVILSFLGLGVSMDMVSWGTMLAEAQTELVLGKWWQMVAATGFMAVFVTAFALLTDALRDALDPKLR
jgi:peptide/nickel transport system permease protein